MGLLGKVVSRSDTVSSTVNTSASPENIRIIVTDFYRKNRLFHCIVLQAGVGDGQKLSADIAGMMAGFHAACVALPDRKCLVLLPGSLDTKLFSHRLSKSTGSSVLFQLDANESSFVFENVFKKLSPYLR